MMHVQQNFKSGNECIRSWSWKDWKRLTI